jgi:hypothetical protein
MSSRLYQIQQGLAVTAASTVQLLPSGTEGDRNALSRLVHPDSDTWPPVVYYRNPDVRYNFSTDVLRHPIASVVRTASSSKLIRFEEVEEDKVITEVWSGGRSASLPLFTIHQLYEMVVNPPELNALAQEYIVWEPRNETTDTYNVEVIGLQVGGGSPGKFGMKRWFATGGPNDPSDPGPRDTPLDNLDVTPTALITENVILTMRMVSKVT